MEHHGEKMKAILKDKGFSMRSLADKLGIHRNSVENHLKSEKLTRRTVERFATVVPFDVDQFFGNAISKVAEQPNSKGMIPSEMYIELQNKYIELQEKHMKLMERFFPNATQLPDTQQAMAMATA